jgi:hypothetical protein
VDTCNWAIGEEDHRTMRPAPPVGYTAPTLELDLLLASQPPSSTPALPAYPPHHPYMHHA